MSENLYKMVDFHYKHDVFQALKTNFNSFFKWKLIDAEVVREYKQTRTVQRKKGNFTKRK